MNDKEDADFSIITTCRPSTSIRQFLDQNPVVRQCLNNHTPITICNKKTEVPEEIISNDDVILNTEYAGRRPNLGELTQLSKRDNKLVCNSDIFFEEDFLSKFRHAIRQTNLSMSGRRYDIPSSIYSHTDFSSDHLASNGYLQSSRTLDYFMLNKLDELTISDQAHLQPGTVGFDIYLASALNEKKRLCDISSYIKVFHRNHEAFRIIYQTNLLINPSAANEFVASRDAKKVIKSNISIKGDLSYCKKFIDYTGRIKKKRIGENISYASNKLITKIANIIERKTYVLNLTLFNTFQREITLLRVSRSLKILICLPVGKKTTENFANSAIEAARKALIS